MIGWRSGVLGGDAGKCLPRRKGRGTTRYREPERLVPDGRGYALLLTALLAGTLPGAVVGQGVSHTPGFHIEGPEEAFQDEPLTLARAVSLALESHPATHTIHIN